MLNVVIDTNVLVSSLSSKSVYHWLIELILGEQLQVYITDEILLEYEEVLTRKYSHTVAANFLNALIELPNVHFTQVFFRWGLIADGDDNKYVDCYVASGAEYLITNDAHFSILTTITFPKIVTVKLEEFHSMLNF